MTTKLTIGAIWRNKRTNEDYELLGHNTKSDRVQLFPVKKNGDTAPSFMTANSLRKNYVAVAKRITEDNKVEVKTAEQPKQEKNIKQEQLKGKLPMRVELLDGKVIACSQFLRSVNGDDFAKSIQFKGATRWFKSKVGQEFLAQHNAKIVYKPLTK